MNDVSCNSPPALQERFDKELQRQASVQGTQSATTETDGSAGTNGVSDVTGTGEESLPGGSNERLEQVIGSQRHSRCSMFVIVSAIEDDAFRLNIFFDQKSKILKY